MRLSGSAAQAKPKGVRHIESWWTALPEYVPPVAWPSLLPVGTVRASYDERRWRVTYGDGAQQARRPHAALQPCATQAVALQPGLQPYAFRLRPYAPKLLPHPMDPMPCHVHVHAHVHAHAPQVWEPLAAGSESLERDETQQDEIPSPVLELFELDAAEVDLTLQPYGLGRQAVTIGVHPATPCNLFRWSSSLAAARRRLGGPSSRPMWARARQATGATCRRVVSSSRPSRR